ncbi:MAG: DNA adenine methylase [Pseudosphingobacterium sp.]|nr:DNA adenine methylase [Pseudosphingobacterium sp.]
MKRLRTPITYYGGKQTLAPKILSLIPKHVLYCEPFIGGGAVFFGKRPSEVEVINDTNRELINFYRVVKEDFVSLEKEIRITLHSRDLYRKATVINSNPDMFSEIKRAWAIWVLSSQSFSARLDGSWGYDLSSGHMPSSLTNKKRRFTEKLAIRLQNCQIECADALYIIQSRDTPNSFFYCDPPYFNSDMGHYDGYSEQDYENLLRLLSAIKGKFLLSSYPSQLLDRYTQENGWERWSVDLLVSVNAKEGNQKTKTEVLTANYPINNTPELDFTLDLL